MRRDELMLDESMQEAKRDAEALRADTVALVESYSPTGLQRAGAPELSARRGDGPAPGMRWRLNEPRPRRD